MADDRGLAPQALIELQPASNGCRRACPVDRPRNWYPGSDSNSQPSRSKRDTSTELGYRGELVLAERFEHSLDRLSTCFLCRLGYASRCGSWDSNPDWARFKRAASAD